MSLEDSGPKPNPDSDREFGEFNEEALLPHTREETEEALYPRFDQFCRESGSSAPLKTDEIDSVQVFRESVLQLFGRSPTTAVEYSVQELECRGVDTWEGGHDLVILAEIRARYAGHSVLPISLAQSDDRPYIHPVSWKFRNEETYDAPVGIIAKISSGEKFVQIEPIFSTSAESEALTHAKNNAVRVRLGSTQCLLGSRFEIDSYIVALLLNAVQGSHETGDMGDDTKVTGPARKQSSAKDPLASMILGIDQLIVDKKPGMHEVRLIAPDVYGFSNKPFPLSLITDLSELPLVHKTYELALNRQAGLFGEPVVKHVWVQPFKKAS